MDVTGNGNFDSIASASDFYDFLDTDVIGSLYGRQVRMITYELVQRLSRRFSQNGWIDEHNRLIGGLVLIQVRFVVNMERCKATVSSHADLQRTETTRANVLW